MFYTYVLRSKKDQKLYTGYTRALEKRFAEHNAGRNFSTRNRGPFELIFYEACSEQEDAMAREKFLKSGPGKTFIKKRLKRFFQLTGFGPLTGQP